MKDSTQGLIPVFIKREVNSITCPKFNGICLTQKMGLAPTRKMRLFSLVRTNWLRGKKKPTQTITAGPPPCGHNFQFLSLRRKTHTHLNMRRGRGREEEGEAM